MAIKIQGNEVITDDRELKLGASGTGTGVFTIAAPDSNTNRTLTLPDEAGTVLTDVGVPSSAMPAGSVIQVVQDSTATRVGATTTSFVDSGLSGSITPSSTSSKVLVMVNQPFFADRNNEEAGLLFRVLRDSNVILNHDDGFTFYFNSASISQTKLGMVYAVSPLDSPNTTSSITYKTQCAVAIGGSSARVDANSRNPGMESTITLMEIAG